MAGESLSSGQPAGRGTTVEAECEEHGVHRAKLGLLIGAVVVALVLIGQERPAGFDAQAGGTAEEQMWEVLVLMGVGDGQPAELGAGLADRRRLT